MTKIEKQIESILNRQKQKIIQITGQSVMRSGVIALCDDGTLWGIYRNISDDKWISEQIPYEIDD